MKNSIPFIVPLFMVIQFCAPQPEIFQIFVAPKTAASNLNSGSDRIEQFAPTAELDPLLTDPSVPLDLSRTTEHQPISPNPDQPCQLSVSTNSSEVVEQEPEIPNAQQTQAECSRPVDVQIPDIGEPDHSYRKADNFECTVCNKAYKSAKGFRYHFSQFHDSNAFLHECTICSKKFARLWHLDRHMRVHTGQRPFICRFCNRTFSQSENLRRHSLIHTHERPFICEYCNNSFTESTTLKRHLLIHTGEKPFQCDICLRQFRQLTHCRRHYQVMHTDVRPFACAWCNRAYGQKDCLIKHLKTCKAAEAENCTV